MQLTITPKDAPLGAEVRGVDLSEPVDDETIWMRVADFMWEPKYPRIRLPGESPKKAEQPAAGVSR